MEFIIAQRTKYMNGCEHTAYFKGGTTYTTDPTDAKWYETEAKAQRDVDRLNIGRAPYRSASIVGAPGGDA